MSAYLKMRVKDANPFSKAMSSNVGGFSFLTRYSCWLYVDGQEIGKLVASSIPYTVEILPGSHRIQLLRSREGSINFVEATTKGIFGGAAALVGGGEGQFLNTIADASLNMTKSDPKKGAMMVSLQDGETMEITVKANLKGHPVPKTK